MTVLNEQEIQLLNLFRRVDDLDRLTIISLLESRPKAASQSGAALTLVGGQSLRVLRSGAGRVQNKTPAGFVASSVQAK